jgi:hypothetical protein
MSAQILKDRNSLLRFCRNSVEFGRTTFSFGKLISASIVCKKVLSNIIGETLS